MNLTNEAAPRSPLRQLRALLEAVALTSGREALRRALPLYLAFFLASRLLLGGETFVQLVAQSSRARSVLWGAWLVATFPAARSLLTAPSSLWLRTMPFRRRELIGAQLALLVAAELPWAATWWEGGQMSMGALALLLAAGGHGALLITRWSPRRGVAAVVLAACMVSDIPVVLRFLAALPAAWVTLHAAWEQAPDRARRRERAVVVGPRVVALATAHVALLWRGHSTVVVRGAAILAFGTVLAGLALRNRQVDTWSAQASLELLFLCPAMVWAVAGCLGPLLRSEAEMAWLLDAYGTPHFTRTAGPGLTAIAVGAAIGAAHGALARSIGEGMLHIDGRQIATMSAAGAAVAWSTVSVLRLVARGTAARSGFVAPLLTSVVAVLPLAYDWRAALSFWVVAPLALLAVEWRARRVPSLDQERGNA